MKKLLCLLLILVIASAVICFPAYAAGSSDTLTVMEGDAVLAKVKVGNEFIYRVGVNAGDYLINSGQGYIRYNSSYVKPVEYGPKDSWGRTDMDAYCFPESIRHTSLVSNYLGLNNYIKYNYTNPKNGAGVFDDVEKPYFKIRFKALASGTVKITHVMEVLSTTVDGERVRLFTDGKANDQLNPVPYQQSSVEEAVALIGDADGDYSVSVMDVTFVQRVTAGVKAGYSEVNTDVDKDGNVNLLDALDISRYTAGMDTQNNVGEWIFESEQDTVQE